jgi:hypothetical protein
VVVERRVCETCDGFGNTLTRGLNGDVIVLLEVDTGVLLGGVVGHAKEIALKTLVGRARDVLAVLPGTVTRSASTSRAATTRLAVSVGVKVAARGTAPSTTWGTVATAGSEVGCVGPATGTTAAVHLRGRTLTSWSPSAATETAAAVHHRGRAVHRCRAALGTTAKVGRDVGRTLAVEAVLVVVLGLIYVETTHVELVSHDGRG